MARIVWSSLDLEKIKKVYSLSDEQVSALKNTNLKEGLASIAFKEDSIKLKEVLALLNNLNPMIIFESKSGWEQVALANITYLESIREDIIIHLENRQSITVAEPLYQLETLLTPYHFTRIHKSFVVNLAKVVSIKTGLNAKLALNLLNGEIVEVSRSYVNSFKATLKI
jgi:DNA-binding LytR/AlgR family response regulator